MVVSDSFQDSDFMRNFVTHRENLEYIDLRHIDSDI